MSYIFNKICNNYPYIFVQVLPGFHLEILKPKDHNGLGIKLSLEMQIFLNDSFCFNFWYYTLYMWRRRSKQTKLQVIFSLKFTKAKLVTPNQHLSFEMAMRWFFSNYSFNCYTHDSPLFHWIYSKNLPCKNIKTILKLLDRSLNTINDLKWKLRG